MLSKGNVPSLPLSKWCMHYDMHLLTQFPTNTGESFLLTPVCQHRFRFRVEGKYWWLNMAGWEEMQLIPLITADLLLQWFLAHLKHQVIFLNLFDQRAAGEHRSEVLTAQPSLAGSRRWADFCHPVSSHPCFVHTRSWPHRFIPILIGAFMLNAKVLVTYS